jgi:transposase InsO family protein
MPWTEVNRVDERMKFVMRALMKEESFTHLCREFGITPKTGYKWLDRFKEDGRAGLNDLSRRPKKSPRDTAEEVVTELVRLKMKRMAWGPKKIRRIYGMSHPGEELPSLSTVSRILSKSGLVKERRKRRGGRDERIQNRIRPEAPNDVWTVDFKGWWYTRKRERCEPLTVRDEYSKYILSIAVLERADTAGVKAEFERLFRNYGLPRMTRNWA